MPAPYTDTEQDALIDQLLADVVALTDRVDTLETDMAAAVDRVDLIELRLGLIEPDLSGALVDIGNLQNDNTTNTANIGTLQSQVGGLETGVTALTSRVDAIEGATVPAVDTLQDDVAGVVRASRRRQENDPEQLAKPQLVQRIAIEKVRRPDGRIAQRVVRPR